MGPGDLAKALSGLSLSSDPNLLAGMERGEDAGVYRLTDELAIIQTLRSEEHTSELQSHSFTSYAVFCLKKKT